MTAKTKRLTINQHWQQISTGNVTLTGCNTAATYQIYVGEDTPNADSDYISDTLATPTPYDFDTPVWVKLNVTNTLDEAELIAIGELIQGTVDGNASHENVLTFSELINCAYNDENLVYTDGKLSLIGVGFQAITVQKSFEIIKNENSIYIFTGDNNNISQYLDGNAEGVLISVENNGINYLLKDDYTTPIYNESVDTNDKLQISVADNTLIIKNLTNNRVWTSPQSDYLANPKYFGIVVQGTAPLQIKAI